jgi:predicted phage terminase large subunit-like protein
VKHSRQTVPQQRFWSDSHRFRLFVGGRGSGKTRAGAIEVLRQSAGTTSLIIAPTYPMLRLGAMETVLSLVAQMGVAVAWNKSDLELRLIGDRRIIFRSADNPDRLRGANVGFLWLDEAAMMDSDIWPTAIATLRHQPGKAIATTTPRGKNWLYERWLHGGDDYSIVESSTTDNPYLPSHFVATLKESMTSEMYQQEVQGKFTDPIGQLFKRHWFSTVDRAPDDLTWYRYWDLATSTKTSADYTASVKAALGRDGIVYLDAGIHVKAEWPDVRRIMLTTFKAEPRVQHGIEEALHGLAVVQELRRDPSLVGITMKGIRVDRDKQSRAMPWAARAEAGAVRLVAGEWVRQFLDEVVAFPSGQHDDYVDAASGAIAMMSKPKVDWGWA